MARDYSYGVAVQQKAGPAYSGGSDYTEAPLPTFYTDQSKAYRDQANRIIGATVNVLFYAIDSNGIEHDITSYIEAGGVGEQSVDVPVDRPDEWNVYTVSDWNIKIRRNYYKSLRAVLRSVNSGDYHYCPIQAYLKARGANDKVPAGRYKVSTMSGPPVCEMILVDTRIDALKRRLYADGVAKPSGRTGWSHTFEKTVSDEDDTDLPTGVMAGSPTPDYFEVYDLRCPIGEWRLEFDVEGDNTAFTVTGPGVEKAGSTSENFYTHDDGANSYLKIEPDFWDSGWKYGDTLEWTTTFSFQARKMRLVEAMYYLFQRGGYESDEFDAGANFPEPGGNNPPSGWMFANIPSWDTEDSTWIPPGYGSISRSKSWDWANFNLFENRHVRFGFSEDKKILEAVAEVGKHGPAYVVPDDVGKLRLIPFGYTTNDPSFTIDNSNGLITAHEDEEAPKDVWHGYYAWDYDTGEFTTIYKYPELESELFVPTSYVRDEEPASIEFLGFSQYDRDDVRDVLMVWQDYWGQTFPTIPFEMDFRGHHIGIGYYLSLIHI